jgi:hypothetical protein
LAVCASCRTPRPELHPALRRSLHCCAQAPPYLLEREAPNAADDRIRAGEKYAEKWILLSPGIGDLSLFGGERPLAQRRLEWCKRICDPKFSVARCHAEDGPERQRGGGPMTHGAVQRFGGYRQPGSDTGRREAAAGARSAGGSLASRYGCMRRTGRPIGTNRRPGELLTDLC